MQKVSNRSVENARGYSNRTVGIIQILLKSREPQHYEEIAKLLFKSERKPPKSLCRSVHKTLMRLVKDKVAIKPSPAFFMFNHDNPADFIPCIKKCRRSYSGVGMHRVGLKAVVSGGLLGVEGKRVRLKHSEYVPSRSPVFGASVKVFEKTVYYELKSGPFRMDLLPLYAEDFLRCIPSGAELLDLGLNSFERGPDIPYDTTLLNYADFSHIIIYIKKGLVRIHALRKGQLIPLPLTDDARLKIETDTLTIMTEAQDILEAGIRTCMQPQNLFKSAALNPSRLTQPLRNF